MFGKERDFTSVGSLIDGLPAPSGTMIIAKLLPEGFNIKALIGKKMTGRHLNYPLKRLKDFILSAKRKFSGSLNNLRRE